MADDTSDLTPFEKDLLEEIDAAKEQMAAVNTAARPILAAENVVEIQKTWKQYNLDQTDLHNASILADSAVKNPEVLTPENYNFLIKTAKKNVWMEPSRPGLDKSIMNWVDSMKSKKMAELSTFLLGTEVPKLLIEIYSEAFNQQNWMWIAEKFEEESAIRRALMDKLDVNFLKNIVTADESMLLPSGINKKRLEELQKQMDAATKSRDAAKTKLERYKALRDKYYKDFIAKGKSEAEAKELADGFAKMLVEAESRDEQKKIEEEMKQIGGERVAQSTSENKENKAKVDEHGLSKAQQESRNILQQRGRGGFRVGEFFAHPTIGVGLFQGYMGAYFRKITGRYTGEEFTNAVKDLQAKAAEKLVKKAVGEGAKTVATGAKVAVKKATPAILAKLSGLIPTGVTQVIAIASFIKSALGLVRNVFKAEFWKDLWSKVQVWGQRALALMIVNPLGVFFGALGMFTPLGPVGAVAGFFLGTGIQAAIFGSGSFATSSVAGGTALTSTVVTGGGLFGLGTAGGLGAIFATGQMIVGIAVGGTFLATLVTITTVGAAMLADPQSGVDQHGPPVAVVVEKSVDKTKLGNDSNDKIVYSISINSKSSQTLNLSISDDVSLENKQGVKNGLPTPVLATPSVYPTTLDPYGSLTINYRPYQITKDLNDSNLINVVTVNVKSTDGSVSEEQKAVAVTTIGNPPVGQPYGFPSSGAVMGLDSKYLSSDKTHRGTFFDGNGKRYWATGGFDIVGAAGSAVNSTVNGTVIYASFDRGSADYKAETCGQSTNPKFNNCAVGGAVIIQSGHYIISYLHLANSLKVSKGATVVRGQPLGVFYGGEEGILPTTFGTNPWHVHYQILRDGVDVRFNDDGVVGKCSQGKIEPTKPVLGGSVVQNTVCD